MILINQHFMSLSFSLFRTKFFELLNLVEEELTKTDTNMQRALTAEVKLANYLNLLAHEEHYYSIAQRFAIGESTMSSIVQDVGRCLNRHLKTTYSKFLRSIKYITVAEQRFRQKYTWPGVYYGAIDG